MKKSLCLILAFLVTVAAITGFAASTAAPAKSVKPDPGIRLAQSVTALTGVAISPLLGVSVFGAWEYFQTPSEKRAQLSFYARPWFWLLGLLIVAMVVAIGPAAFVTDLSLLENRYQFQRYLRDHPPQD